jgi:sodium-dependent dicarboxylate transporter 2/3/5
MLTMIADALKRMDAATRTPQWRWAGVFIGLGAAIVMVQLPAPGGLSTAAWQTAAVGMLMAGWWVGQVLPMAVTGLVPLVAFPVLGLATPGQVSPSYAHPLLFLMLGGFLLAAGMERVGLQHRLVAVLLAPSAVRRSPARVVLALMVATAVLSGLVSNTATTVMLLPVAVALGARCTDDARQQSAFVLCLAYAASVGGVSTLVGTPPNAVLAGVASDQGMDIGFARWMALGVPFVALALPLVWWVVTRVVIPLPRSGLHIDAPIAPAWTASEGGVLAVVGLALAAWLTRAPLHIAGWTLGGWGAGLGWRGAECDALVALVAGALMFTIPRRSEGRWTLLLDWQGAERAVPWSVILLLGGGFALATQISNSGLTTWVAQGAVGLRDLPTPITVFGVCLVMSFVTELTSNTASTQIAVPLLAAASAEAQVVPQMWMIPATISASCAFMMPVATAPNAIATEAGAVSPADMALCGLVLNPVLALVVTALCLGLVPILF